MDAFRRMVTKPREDIGEVGPRVDVLEHAAADEGERRGGRGGATLRACGQPLLSADY